jgi:replicative DNA helicase
MMEQTLSLSESLSLHQGKTEQLFAGAVLINEDYALRACGWLEPASFRDARLGQFWSQVKDGKPAASAAMDLGLYFEIAGYMAQVVSSFDVPYLAQTISADRYLIEASSYLGDMARAIGERNVDGLRDLARCVADASPYTGETIPGAVQIGREFEAMLDHIDGRVELTGIPNLDAATGGLEKQTLTILAARPSVGKTALGSQIMQNGAAHGRKVLMFQAEMARAQLWARMACGRLKIAWRDVLAKRVTAAQIQQIKAQSKQLQAEFGDNLLIDDSPNLTNEDIYRKVGAVEPDLVIVDHLDLINRKERGKLNEVIRLGNNSRFGKIIAKEFDIPCLYLMQLNRDLEHRESKRPELKDLRFSGDIEQDADNVVFIYRADYHEGATEEPPKLSKTELIVGKFRNGIRNIAINVIYDLEAQWFYAQTPPGVSNGRR